MKKLSAFQLVSILILGSLVQYTYIRAEIVVRQDKQGNLVITNETPKNSVRKGVSSLKRSGGLAYVPVSESTSTKVPVHYHAKIKELSRQHGVEEALIIAVCRAESGFNPFAVSNKGAVGIMQLMAETAMMYGVVDRYNAFQNMEAGVKHLKYLHKKFNGNLRLVLAAYNAGEEAVNKYGGIPPYSETQGFVKRVLKYMGMATDGLFDTKLSTKIYQYRSKEGKIVITDTYPSNATGPVTVID